MTNMSGKMARKKRQENKKWMVDVDGINTHVEEPPFDGNLISMNHDDLSVVRSSDLMTTFSFAMKLGLSEAAAAQIAATISAYESTTGPDVMVAVRRSNENQVFITTAYATDEDSVFGKGRHAHDEGYFDSPVPAEETPFEKKNGVVMFASEKADAAFIQETAIVFDEEIEDIEKGYRLYLDILAA